MYMCNINYTFKYTLSNTHNENILEDKLSWKLFL